MVVFHSCRCSSKHALLPFFLLLFLYQMKWDISKCLFKYNKVNGNTQIPEAKTKNTFKLILLEKERKNHCHFKDIRQQIFNVTIQCDRIYVNSSWHILCKMEKHFSNISNNSFYSREFTKKSNKCTLSCLNKINRICF